MAATLRQVGSLIRPMEPDRADLLDELERWSRLLRLSVDPQVQKVLHALIIETEARLVALDLQKEP